MTPDMALEYALTRVQARYAERPSDAQWARLEAISDLPVLLDALRAGPLRPWVSHVTPTSPPHDVEAGLRRHWRSLLAEVHAWLPPGWQPVLAWTQWLCVLPALVYLMRGEPPIDWMLEDGTLRPYLDADPAARIAAFRRGELAPLLKVAQAGGAVAHCWADIWRSRWPTTDHHIRLPFEMLVRVVLTHLDDVGTPASLARAAIQSRLENAFRRHTLHPVQPFLYLALTALDVQRLRGLVLTRLLFPPAGGPS